MVAPWRWDLVFQSRSGPPSVPWLEPDVNDHLRVLAKDGVPAVVVVPVGFVSDHMEVVHDLDVEAAETAASLGLAFARATGARLVGAVRADGVRAGGGADRGSPGAPPLALGGFGRRRGTARPTAAGTRARPAPGRS